MVTRGSSCLLLTPSVSSYYVVTNYADTTLTVARWTAENCGDTGAIHNGQTYSGSFGAPHILGKVRWYSVYSGGARGCRWNLYGRNNGQGWRALGHMQFSTTPERFDANGKWVSHVWMSHATGGTRQLRHHFLTHLSQMIPPPLCATIHTPCGGVFYWVPMLIGCWLVL